jgi:hypothetical protein
MAPHIIDLPIWALDLGVPLVTSCSGGRYVVRDDGDAPDVQEVIWQYPNLTMTWMMSTCNSFAFDFGRGSPARRLGIYFHALRGTLFSDYGKHEVVPEGNLLEDARRRRNRARVRRATSANGWTVSRPASSPAAT